MDVGPDAVVVRSPIEQGNFLFRVPAAFQRIKGDEDSPWLVELGAGTRADGALLRLRIHQLSGADLRAEAADLIAARDERFADRKTSSVTRTGDAARIRMRYPGKDYALWVLAVRDGDRLYELRQESALKNAFDEGFTAIAEGFTILDPKGVPEIRKPTAEQLKAETLEHDYYRIKLLKPEGFTKEQVDPDTDQGIWTHLRCEDEHYNLCEIKVRIHLTRTLKPSLDELAAQKAKAFDGQYASARIPKRPKRIRFGGAKEAFQLKMVGKLKGKGLVVQEDYRLFEHDNGRTYEIQLTTYAGAQREFAKQIKAFWKSVKIRSD